MTSEVKRKPVIVYVGIEWDRLPESFGEERRGQVKRGVEAAMEELVGLGYDARWCGVGMEVAEAVEKVGTMVEGDGVDGVLIGAGLRVTGEAVVLFEAIVNVVHARCPRAVICFNSTPGDSAAAVQRWIAP